MLFTIQTVVSVFLAAATTTKAFTFQTNPTSSFITASRSSVVISRRINAAVGTTTTTTTGLWMNNDTEEEKKEVVSEEVEAELVSEEESHDIPKEEALVAVADEEVEDPEITAMKEEIASLEVTLRSKRMEFNRLEDAADELTEGGYLRKCADMENTRKRSVSSHQTSRYVSRATIVKKFLPIIQEMDALKEKYSEEPFGKSYDALRSAMMEALEKKVDVLPFESEPGKEVNAARDAVVGYERSETVPKGIIIQTVKPGLEVKGNVISPAECIVSKGAKDEEEVVTKGFGKK